MFSVMSFIVDNMHYFQTKSSVHEINTRHKNQLHIPLLLRNVLPILLLRYSTNYHLRISGLNMFVKSALRKYLLTHPFLLKNFYLMISACLFLDSFLSPD